MLGVDDLRRRGQTGQYGYTGYSGKGRSKEYYMLEAKKTASSGSTNHKPRETGPDQSKGVAPRGIRMQTDFTVTTESQAGWDEESQHSTSRIIKNPNLVSTASHGM